MIPFQPTALTLHAIVKRFNQEAQWGPCAPLVLVLCFVGTEYKNYTAEATSPRRTWPHRAQEARFHDVSVRPRLLSTVAASGNQAMQAPLR